MSRQMPKNKYNHTTIIKSKQPASTKSIYPGMIIQFNYKGDRVFDKNPLILVLWNEYRRQSVLRVIINILII